MFKNHNMINKSGSLFLAAFIMFTATHTQAQDFTIQDTTETVMEQVAKLKWKKKLFIADGLWESGSYLNAIAVYEMVLEDKPQDRYTLNRLGEANYLMRHYEAAKGWFSKLVPLDSLTYPYSQYYLAKSLKSTGDYEKAIKAFEKFHNTRFKKEGEEMLRIKSMIRDEIDGCKLGISMSSNPVKVTVQHLDSAVNHPLTDFSPYPMDKGHILYAALTSDSAIVLNDSASDRYARLYTSRKVNDIWQPAERFDFNYNSGEYHVGNGTFSIDRKRFYFTRCTERSDLTMSCRIFESYNHDTAWSEPEMLGNGINGKGVSSSHPMIAVNKEGDELLFFSSDMDGGIGGYDIWFSVWNEGSFGAPQNLGEIINTAYDEQTPWFETKANKLYFSSNGRINIGGFDIYSSEQDSNGNWSEPLNLGYPVNSSVDDLYYVLEDKKSGYLVSNRPGGLSLKSPTCCDDILSFKYPPTYVYLEGTVLEEGAETRKAVGEGTVYVYQLDNDSLIARVELQDGGYFNFKLKGDKKYKVVASSKKYEDVEMIIHTEDLDEGEVINKELYMKKRPFWEGLNVGTVYYDFDRSKLKKEARPVLDTLVKILHQFPKMVIEISGHTDNFGDSLYNIKLSNRRAEAVYNYLLRKDVPGAQLTQRGYGATQPVAPNRKADGSDNPEGRQLNRRTVFSVVGELDEASPIRQKGR